MQEKNEKYRKTPKGKEIWHKKEDKRRRNLEYIPLNSYFDGCCGHHIDKKYVIHIPKILHKSISHRQSDENSMKKINLLAFAFMEHNSI